MRYAGLLYRALNPVFARDPLSGEGARREGGRFNPPGMPALYTSLSVLTALRETNRVGTLQPTTLVAYEADIEPILNTTDPAQLAGTGMTMADLAADDWRLQMRRDGKAKTQRWAAELKGTGYAGLLVRSFARAAGPDDLNLVLWVWGPTRPTFLRVVDDEGRLG